MPASSGHPPPHDDTVEKRLLQCCFFLGGGRRRRVSRTAQALKYCTTKPYEKFVSGGGKKEPLPSATAAPRVVVGDCMGFIILILENVLREKERRMEGVEQGGGAGVFVNVLW